MKRTTIMVKEETLLDLAQIAAQRDTSTSQVIREALSQYVAEVRAREAETRPLPSFVGIAKGPADLGERAEAYLEELTDSEQGWN